MKKTKPGIAQEKKEKETALRFFSLLSPATIQEARDLFTPKAKHHNPYLRQGIDALLGAIIQVQKEEGEDMPDDGLFDIKNVLVDGNLVAVHTTLQSKSNPKKGMRQVHLFRFRGNKIVEYWDVTQMAPATPNARRMF
jgi:predicted SnoaL-like aldol condensation-catalyzing enzyme